MPAPWPPPATGTWSAAVTATSRPWSACPTCSGGETLLLNPGTIGGVGQAPATYILGDLETLTFDFHEIDKALERQPWATARILTWTSPP